MTVTFNDKGTSFTRMGSFRQATLTERLADPQSAIIAGEILADPQRAIIAGEILADPQRAIIAGERLADPQRAIIAGEILAGPQSAIIAGEGGNRSYRKSCCWYFNNN